METLIKTTDGIEVRAYDILQVSINGGEWLDYSTISNRSDASYAVNKCRAGSVMNLEGRVFRYRIVRKGLDGRTVFERSEIN